MGFINEISVLRSITKFIDSSKIYSLTDLMLQTTTKTDGKPIDTEIFLKRDDLCGRVDVIRQVDDGYILQEEKTSDPPQGIIAWENDLLQLDAYAFLAEKSKYSPVVGGIIVYSDLKPRKVKPNPEHAVAILRDVIWLLGNDKLPEENSNKNACKKCSYYALCQVLPKEGGLAASVIRKPFDTPSMGIIQKRRASAIAYNGKKKRGRFEK